MRKILLGEKNSKKSINEDNFINVEISSKEHVLPVDNITQTLDSYKEYLSEKDSSNIYRLIFTINPVCTNILFNTITEVVWKEGYEEGSEKCFRVTKDKMDISNAYINGYKNLSKISQTDAIRDTALSHPEISSFDYHCGIDIFNNHMLRKRGFKVVNKLLSSATANERSVFNTIRDFLRDADGNIISEKIVKLAGSTLSDNKTQLHLYQVDETKTFQESVHDNLVESEGWIGFINPVTMSIPNYVSGTTAITINKCINNKKAGEFIDMYPDRTLYSFIPKYNKYRNRLEYNWDCFITYPYQNIEDNELVNGGIRCYFNDITEIDGSYFDDTNGKTNFLISFKTELKNSFYSGSFVRFIFYNENNSIETDLIKVEGVGLNGNDTQHIFSVNFNSILGSLVNIGANKSSITLGTIKIRVKKNVKGIDCKYYIRKFRRLPNFKNTDVYISNNISESDISTNAKNDFTRSVNQLAFAQNIYSDKVAQIVFNDDVITTGIRDNLGRRLSEIYLTILKRNKGHKEWYDSGITAGADIEFSHCFGTVSSGFDLPADSIYTKYNVHRLTADNRSSNALENDITDTAVTFYGDIVEFSPYTLEETVLEDVYHRFNTEQRETKSNEYSGLTYDAFAKDDYDVSGTFKVEEKTLQLSNVARININDEGYYYKPHYRIKLRSFDETVKQGAHTKISFSTEFSSNVATNFSGTTSLPYGLNSGDTLYLINPTTTEQVNAIINTVSGPFNMQISFTADKAIDITKFAVYKPNILKPDYAYELNDGTGRYIWREVLPENKMMYGDELYDSMFANGAHYFHKNINFYLKRQDPSGEYGLNKINDGVNTDVFTGAARGEFKDISMAEVESQGENDIC